MTIPVFPSFPGQEWPLARSVIWKNLRQESQSGKETRIAAYTFPRYQWQCSFSTLRSSVSLPEFQQLMAFINLTGGGFTPFYFTDPDDNAVSGQILGIGNGTTSAFQLIRSFGGFVDPVQSVNGTPTIYINGTATTAFTISNVGVVTFNSPPANGAALTWSGVYYWLCRFDEDTSAFSNFGTSTDGASHIYEMKKLSFTTVKL